VIFRQLFDAKSSTYTYLLADESSRSAVLIDTVYERFQRDAALLDELGLSLRFTLETHVHADHVTAAWLFRRRTGSRIAVGARAGTTGHDLLLDDRDRVPFGARYLTARATPGHTAGCVSYVLDDESLAFTGDALLIRGAGRTDFQGGDPFLLFDSVHERLFSLPDQTVLYPAHDYAGRTCTSVAEERSFNPRLGGTRSRGDFVGFMSNLDLPHPQQIEVAVPANLICGQPNAEALSMLASAIEASWAPVNRTYAGVPEVPPAWLFEHRRDVRIVDVREPAEFDGELGHIEDAELLPLGALRGALAAWDNSAATVIVCRSGARSAQGALILEAAGFGRVGNLAGGMIAWRSAGHPVIGGRREPRNAGRSAPPARHDAIDEEVARRSS
jgi:glyoxylase-like metal-dependent hydrolase (beta-lactamase superfamily II)/rhodanese-related sulfurtransferase